MIKNFSQYLVEEEREVYFTFGRMNPPTIGHGKVMDTLATESKKYDYKVYLSQSNNPQKDPLPYNEKIKHVRKMFPKHARQVIMDNTVKNVFDVATKLYEQGYTKINMVVSENRIREFEVLLNKYNGTKARHGFYNFRNINVISAGEYDPDATGIEGILESRQVENASRNDFVTFSQGVPKSMSNQDARKLFNDVRKGMGLKEEREFKNHIELQSVSETREQYVHGDLFQVGDTVVIKESEEIGVVSVLGANYVIVESNGRKLRKWLDSIELIERQDPDIKDREGTQPARYHAGLKKSTKVARDAHFKKHGKKADDDDSAYKPAPGDATAKTRPSKYTKQFKDMYDEDCWDGYKQVGMKKKGNKSVPNCIPEARRKQAVANNKVQKLVTGFGMTYKGKEYDEIDLELVGINNSTKVVTFRILHPKEHIGDEVKIPFKTLRRGRFAATDTSKINEYGGPKISRADYLKKGREYHSVKEDVSQQELNDLEKFADRLLNKFDIDIEFTRHFKDRMNDPRNKPAISVEELKSLFKKMADNKGKRIKKYGNAEAVLKDMQSDLNLPVVVNWKNGEFEVVNKTIMRKKGFKTTSPVVSYESVEEDLTPRWMKDMIGSKLNPKNYKQALDVLTKIIDRKKKENNGKMKHAVVYYAAQVAKQYGGVDARNLAKAYDTSVKEETDPVKSARAAIDREKESDKKKHDNILDRARLARARLKNRETK